MTTAHEALAAALGRVLADGLRPPCTDGTGRWTGDHAEIRAKAVELCGSCALIEPCALAGEDEDFGVWGAVDVSDRPTQRRRRAADPARPRRASHGRDRASVNP